ncbi:hypothetical protein MFRU_003g05180 [Monilinia fructicola]|nr:hypothetical protein MFRU_003g05180 [Monilinia fructicola]
MPFDTIAQEEHCRYRISPTRETIFYFVDPGGKTVDPKINGFLAPKIRCDTLPSFGTQAFADYISSAWPSKADDRPELLRLHVNKNSAAADYVSGDRIWTIKVHEMRDEDPVMWKAYTLAACHTPTIDIFHLNHAEIILLLSRIPATAVGMDITCLLKRP